MFIDTVLRVVTNNVYVQYDGLFHVRILTLIIKLIDLPSETFKGVFIDGVYLIIVK